MRKINDTVLLEMMKDVKAGKITQVDVANHFSVSPAAICKRLKRLELLKPLKSLEKLTKSKQKFALEIASGKNQKDAALCSHSCTSVNSAKSLGCALIKEPDIKLAISDLLAQEGLTRRYRIEKLKQLVDSWVTIFSLILTPIKIRCTIKKVHL